MEDPFVHLPQLRGCLKPPEHSELRVTGEVLARWDERAQELGHPPGWRLSEQQIEASRRETLGALDGSRSVWVFSYGSLMWDPGFHFAEVRLADLQGYQRRFCFKSWLGRGSADHPALMLSLEPRTGGCTGLAFRIDAALADSESALLWRREMLRGCYRPLLLPVATPQGAVTALVFAANPAHADHVPEMPLAQAAAIICRASGMLGSNRAYLEQLDEQLRRLDIEDLYTTQLLVQVRALAGP